MADILSQGKVRFPDHTVGLCDTGQPAEGEQNKAPECVLRPQPRQAAGDFQNAGTERTHCFRPGGEQKVRNEVHQVKQDHITAERGDGDERRGDGRLRLFQQRRCPPKASGAAFSL